MAEDKKTSPPANALKDNRILYFVGEFDEENAANTVKDIIELECEAPNKDIVLYIDSFGGMYHSFISIHDALKLSRCDIATVCIGKAMSAGQMLLMSGTKGKRFITPNSTVMVHQIASGVWGKLAEIENEVAYTKQCQELIEELFARYTKINKSQLTRLMAKDTYLTAKQALELGIVDCILDHPKQLWSRIKN